jgi:predicted DNA-binding transcriptional regulator AlpA
MREWMVTASGGPRSWPDHEAWLRTQEELLEVLAGLPGALGVAGWGRVGELGAVFSVEAASLAEAAARGAELFEAALEKIGHPGAERLEVEPVEPEGPGEPRIERRVRTGAGSAEALTAGEIARFLGVSRARVYQLIETHEDFPRPVAHTPRGAMWSRADVETWAARWARRPGRPAATSRH